MTSVKGRDPARPGTVLGLKILVAGGFGVGKTTSIGAVSDFEPLTTEEYLTEAGTGTDCLDGVEHKSTTTVAMDYGRITLDITDVPGIDIGIDTLDLHLFGTPGQERFTGIWYELARGAIGAIVLADTRRLDSSFRVTDFVEQQELPFIVALNQFDGAHRYEPEDVRDAFGVGPGIPVMTIDARRRPLVASALVTLVTHALNHHHNLLDAP
ncbi:GTP-binding protein [Streptomyces sp. 4F14]|uniref:GTP-binding protein n=1 Tax=Streptomyces sp. 4F14 TaxID=3394380 RepID=UPI003A86FB0E